MGGVGVVYTHASTMHGSSYDCVRALEGPTGAGGRRMVCV